MAAPRPGAVVDQRDLVERAKQGDHDAFATLAGDAVARLDAAARLILRDPELARDGVQDGFIRAWRTLPALRDPDRFDAWLRRLVVHSCIDIMRRRRHRAIEVELTPIDGPAGVDFTSAIADRDLVDEALRHLDPEWRAVVVMHYFLGMPLPEVASMLGIPLGTAKSRLHRSLAGDAHRGRRGRDARGVVDPGRAARMMPSDRFDRRLPAILDEISQPRTPDYFDDLLGLTARTRQRPAWTLPERWLPMVDIARQPAFARQVPWRPIAVLALILLLLAASLAFVIGSRHPLPAPFGPARNGLVAYAKAGDIYTADPVTGEATAIVTGPETTCSPVCSLDGTRFAFERRWATARVRGTGSSSPGQTEPGSSA